MSDRHHAQEEPLQMAKVLRIRAELAAGTYHVPTAQLAESLIRHVQEQTIKDVHREHEHPKERH